MCNQMLRNFYSSCTIRVICLGHAGEVVVQTPYILKVSKRDTHICYLLKRLGRYRNFILNVPLLLVLMCRNYNPISIQNKSRATI